MQADRACYIRRAADDALLEAIAAERFAYVFGPRASGKSSLMGRTIRRLRGEGQAAAVIDLAQIASRADVDSARWHYSMAYRICRELRLKVDLQGWWQERNLLLNEQRLVEFFWDIVLADSDVAITIFFDEVERVIDLPFATELCAAIHSCYLRRVSEPEFSRLNFVALGVVAPEQLCPDPSVSPFSLGRAIALDDFTLEQCQTLAPGLSGAEHVVKSLIARIHGWTHGQPYLTQKLLRGLARKGSRLDEVETVLHELLLAPSVALKEPYLSHIRAMLTDGSARSRQATAMLLRLRRGGELIYDPGSAGQSLLRLAGLVSSDENGMLRFRNRIVERVFDEVSLPVERRQRWQQQALTGAAAAAALVIMTIWYLRVLPRPYIDTLTLVSSDYELALQAHERLSRLPGFGGRADGLLENVMVRRSQSAETIAEARAADGVLRDRLGQAGLADRLLAEYWVRRAERSARNGERDPALMQAIAGHLAGSPRASVLAANLIDSDYVLLDQTVHFAEPLVQFAVDWERGQIVGVDAAQELFRAPLMVGDRRLADTSMSSGRPVPLSITAPQQTGVTRGFFVDEPGRAGSLQLRLTVEHARPADLLLRLRAPSGAAAEVGLPSRDGGLERYVLTGSSRNDLSRLADESITGQWELTVFDRLNGVSGRLVSWGLSFPGVPQTFDDDPVAGIDLPDSVATSQVALTLSADGRRALAVPTRLDARGAASVWDLGTGAPIVDLPLTDRTDLFRFLADDRLLGMGPARANLWQLGNQAPVAEFVSVEGFAAAPALSPDRGFFSLIERARGRARITLVDAAAGRVLGAFTDDLGRSWALATDAGFLAVIDGSRRGRLLDAADGEVLAEFFHDRDLERVFAGRDQIIAVDTTGDIVSWHVDPSPRTLAPRDGKFLGSSNNPDSIAISADGRFLSFIDADGMVSVVRLADGYRHAAFGHGRGAAIGATFNPDGSAIASAVGTTLRLWRLPTATTARGAFPNVATVALDPSGELAVLGYRNGQVKLVGNLPAVLADEALPVGDYVGHRGVVTTLAVSADSELAASGGSDGLVRVWDTTTGMPSPYLMRHPAGPIGALAFSRDGRWLISAGPRSARVFELDTGSLASEVEVDGQALSVAFAADGRSVAIGDTAGNIYLAAPDGSQGIVTIRGRSAVTALSFASDSVLLASGTGDGDLIFWNTLETRAIGQALQFPGPVRWIGLADGAVDVRVQSGSWLYRLERSDTEAQVVAARLLPASLRLGSALVSLDGARVRGLAIAGGGHLTISDIELAGATADVGTAEVDPAAPGPAAPGLASLASRDWARVLGLEIDPESGDTRRLLR